MGAHVDSFPIKTTMSWIHPDCSCLITKIISSSMRTNTDYFNHWQIIIIIIIVTVAPSSGCFTALTRVVRWRGGRGSKAPNCPLELILCCTPSHFGDAWHNFPREKDRHWAPKLEIPSISFLTVHTVRCARTQTHTALIHTRVPLRIIWRFAVGGEAGTRSTTTLTPSGPRSCSA